MDTKFEVILLKGAVEFLEGLNEMARRKMIFNIDKSRYITDPKLFKKLTGSIWEFRTIYQGIHYRLLAFWDKRDDKDVLVIATHGMIKKVNRVPRKEIQKAENIRKEYLKQ